MLLFCVHSIAVNFYRASAYERGTYFCSCYTCRPICCNLNILRSQKFYHCTVMHFTKSYCTNLLKLDMPCYLLNQGQLNNLLLCTKFNILSHKITKQKTLIIFRRTLSWLRKLHQKCAVTFTCPRNRNTPTHHKTNQPTVVCTNENTQLTTRRTDT